MTRSCNSGVDWSTIDAVIFDVDGTLFDHLALRRPMMLKLLSRVLSFRMSPRDVVTLQTFRRMRDRLAHLDADNIGVRQYEQVAAKVGRPSSDVAAIASQWLCEEPLPLVARYGFADVNRFIAALRRRGIRVGVFSDYPTDGKLKALDIDVEIACDAGQPEIGRLKPHPAGFLYVAQRLSASPSRCLIIGDRDDRDGEAARRGGFQLLLKTSAKSPIRRGEFSRYSDLVGELDEIALYEDGAGIAR
jgi:phosphoglycolate phosphatase/putative hydrolase of the HAD superfamily